MGAVTEDISIKGKANLEVFSSTLQDLAATDRNIVVVTSDSRGSGKLVPFAKKFPGQVEIVDLRTLFPLDEEMIFESVKKHGRCLVLTEEQQNNSFAEALAGRISKECFRFLDAPVEVIGALNLPAVPMNTGLEKAMLPNPEKVSAVLKTLLDY